MNFSRSLVAYVFGIVVLLAVMAYVLLAPGFTDTPEPTIAPSPTSSPSSSPFPTPNTSPSRPVSLDVDLNSVLLNSAVIAGEWVNLSEGQVVEFEPSQFETLELDLAHEPLRGAWRSLPGGSNGHVTRMHEVVLLFASAAIAEETYQSLDTQLVADGLVAQGDTFADDSFMSYAPQMQRAVFINRMEHKLYLLYLELTPDVSDRLSDLLQQWAIISNGRLARL